MFLSDSPNLYVVGKGDSMNLLNKNKTGFAVGLFYALFHAVWALMIAAGIAESFLDWVLSLHSLTVGFTVHPFGLVRCVLLVLYAFTAGYALGWSFAWIFNLVSEKNHPEKKACCK